MDIIDIKQPTEKGHFFWKYFDLHRFIYFINEKKLFFTRLDKFEDPIEGVRAALLRQKAFLKNHTINPDEINPSIPEEVRIRLANEKKLFDVLEIEETNKYQKSQFVNCWFYGDRESMAMWNLYSLKDSVALKIEVESLISSLKISFETLLEKHNHHLRIIGNKVQYFKLNPFDILQPEINIPYAALKKDVSYSHENEYRLVIVIPTDPTIENIPFFEVPLSNFEELKLTIITHPDMEDWKFENIKRLLVSFNANFKLEKSATVLRK